MRLEKEIATEIQRNGEKYKDRERVENREIHLGRNREFTFQYMIRLMISLELETESKRDTGQRKKEFTSRVDEHELTISEGEVGVCQPEVALAVVTHPSSVTTL